MRGTKRFQKVRWYGMFGATCLVFLLLSCGGGGGDSETGSPSGSGQIMLTLQIDESQTETFGLKQTGAEFDCVGNHIDTIEILVLDASGNVIAEGGPFNCVDGTATLSAVAAGRDYTVQVNALDQEGFTIFSGEVTGVTVLANRVNTVGPVILRQVMNRKPRIMPPIGDKTVSEGEPLVFTVTAEDPDAAHTLAYSASDLPPGAVFDPVTREFSWTPGFLDAGVYQVMFRVVDDGDPPMSDAETVNIAVGDVNRPPAMDPLQNYGIDEGELLEIIVTATDPDNDLLTFSAGSLPPGAVFDPLTQKFSWQPGFQDAGSYNVLFSVVDDGSPPLSDFQEITITVGDANSPPVLDPIGNQAVDEGELLTFVVTARDPDNDPLEFRVENSNLPSGATFNAQTQRFSWDTGFEDAGNYSVTFVVSDVREDSLSDAETITITVGNVNRPPVLNPIGAKSIDLGVQSLLSFTVTGSDPDGDPLTYSVLDPPSGSTFQNQVFRWQPSTGDIGTYIVPFRVSDNQDPPLSDTENVQITVSLTRPRVVSTSPANGATAVSPDIPSITAVFSRDMNPSTVIQAFGVFYISDGVVSVSGQTTYSNRVATFTIDVPTSGPRLPFGTVINVGISGTAADINGVSMGSGYSWSFTTQDG